MSASPALLERPRDSIAALGRLLLAAALLLGSAGCARSGARSEAPLAFCAVSEGLREPHRGTAPLLELVSCLPPRERPGTASCHTSRLYRDGGYYLLQPGGADGGRWAWLSNLRPQGREQLEQLFESVCGATDPLFGNDAGSTRYLVNAPGCRREFVVTGVPAGGLAGLARVPEIIGRNLEKIPPGR